MSRHTKGPWTAFFSERNARTGTGGWYFTTADGPLPLDGTRRANLTAEANARLIAAAPDLLAALKGWCRGCRDAVPLKLGGDGWWHAPSGARDYQCDNTDAAREAIRKASEPAP